ncbi:hypothetical protein GCM10027511_31580 [Hymenobacter humi]
MEWAGDPQQCPPWIGFPSRAGLPAGLEWSGTQEVPAIGAGIRVYLNSFGPAVVRAYFHADGFLGVLCEFTEIPAWFRRQSPDVSLGHLFGRELEPARAAPLNLEDGLQSSVAESGGNAPAVSPADDWIPDYPLLEEEEVENQDGCEYPENPLDEQRD